MFRKYVKTIVTPKDMDPKVQKSLEHMTNLKINEDMSHMFKTLFPDIEHEENFGYAPVDPNIQPSTLIHAMFYDIMHLFERIDELEKRHETLGDQVDDDY